MRWAIADRLLDDLLDLPEAQRITEARRLGAEHGVTAELEQMIRGLGASSILDESIFDLVDAIGNETESLVGTKLGEWEVGEEIGRGGMSVVYQAVRRGERFEQHAAVKVLSAAFMASELEEFFQRECQALSALNHPGIARLIHSGMTSDGRPYMIIEFIDGDPLDKFASDNKLDIESRVRLILKVTNAVAHAHRHLFVHRDIKPSNILVDHRGDPHLLDFGVVQWLSPSNQAAAIRSYSPGFAAPEQIEGETVSTAVDVYSLGRILSHLSRDFDVDPELTAIRDRAMHPEPGKRYLTATELAEDLVAWLANQPVRAMGRGLGYRGRKFAVRNWRWLSLAAGLMLAVLAGSVATGWQAREARLQSQKHSAVADFMLSMFQQADILTAGSEMKVTDLLREAAEQASTNFADQPQLLVPLYTLIASGQTELTNYDAALEVLQRAEGIIAAGGISSADEAEFLIQRGRLQYELGEFQAAAATLDDALSLLQPIGDTSDLYFTAGANRVSYLIDAEQYSESRLLADSLMTELQDSEVSLDIQSLMTHRYAVALEVTAEVDEALIAYRSALELQARADPDNDLGRAQILIDYAIAQYSAEQLPQAELAAREVLEIYERHFEAPHPRISSALHNLAFTILDQGRVEEAVPLLKQSYEMSVALHGENHFDSVLELSTYGIALAKSGDKQSAEAIFQESLEKLATYSPDMIVMRGAVHTYLADLQFQEERFSESRLNYEKALELFSGLPDDHPRVEAATARLAEIDDLTDESLQ